MYDRHQSEKVTRNAEWVSVGGVRFLATDMDTAVKNTVAASNVSTKAVAIRLANAYCVYLTSKDPAYREMLARPSSINLPDGAPVAAAMRMQLHLRRLPPQAERIRGPEFFRRVLDKGRISGTKHFFLGGSEESIEKLIKAIQLNYPGVDIAGYYSPPYGTVTPEFLDRCVQEVEKSKPQIVWVGLGTPKQDFVAQHIVDKIAIHSIGVGAAFDFVSGAQREAPSWVQRNGIEWLYRLATEPRRLWRRYFFGNIGFLRLVIRHRDDWQYGVGANVDTKRKGSKT